MKKNDRNVTIGELRRDVRRFVEEREWERFHNPKDLAEAICIEAAELLQLSLWIRPEESRQIRSNPSKVHKVEQELADVVIYCLGMANTLGIDLTGAVLDKLQQNRIKYPADRYKGKAYLNL